MTTDQSVADAATKTVGRTLNMRNKMLLKYVLIILAVYGGMYLLRKYFFKVGA